MFGLIILFLVLCMVVNLVYSMITMGVGVFVLLGFILGCGATIILTAIVVGVYG